MQLPQPPLVSAIALDPFTAGAAGVVATAGVFGNYHFPIKSNPKIDPYLGLALVYQHVSSSWSGGGVSFGSAAGSTTDFAGQGGVRYFFSEKLAGQAQVGFGYGTLGLGVTWKL